MLQLSTLYTNIGDPVDVTLIWSERIEGMVIKPLGTHS